MQIALIGFGEAASTFSGAARWDCRGYDVLADRRQAMGEVGVSSCDSAADALRDADLVLSLVTADNALPAARDYAPLLQPGAIWCDMNSVAPDTKREAASAVDAAGGRYVDVAILAPVQPARLGVPLLVSGDHAGAASDALVSAGFGNVRMVGDEIGRASSIKMIRSVMVKGLEALTDEMMAAANAAGVTDEVLASLDRSEKSVGWAERAAYNLERMATHGARRAAEMEEVARTLATLGVEPLLTNATVTRQRDAAARNTRNGNPA